ncbi:PAS domain S-box protein [Halorientalis brevis]|uniref:histidine kinase n=1 Tax=Halorientalis brevis TaxID=1126241 RepID=A0ABD6C7E0_9EURY|nr:PAS domain S-box protein [Halorientalis brevis]
MNGRDESAHPFEPTVPRVRLLVADERNRELLTEWLADTYDVQVGTDADGEPFDLCLVDAISFARHREWLQDHKERLHPVFLPVVLVSRDPPSEQLDPEAWTDIDGLYVIDEIVSIPVEKSVLSRRLENLIERRHLSQQLSGRLERSRERFRTLFDGTPDPTLVLSAGHKVQYVNDAFCAQFATDHDAVLDESIERLEAFSTSTAATIGDAVDRRLAGGDVETIEVSYGTPAGGDRFAEIKVSTLDTDGDDDAVVIMRDVTERRWFERTLQSLHAASRQLFDAVTETEVSHRIVETVTEVFDLSGVAVYLQPDPGGPLEPAAQSLDTGFMRESLPAVPSDDSSLTGHVFTTGTLTHFDDIHTSPHIQTHETDMRAGIFAPLGGHGVLVVGSSEVGAFDDRTEKLVALLAGTARTALDRIERERDLAESEQRFRQIADSVHEVIWMTDAAGEQLLYLSPGFEELVGRSAEEFGDDPASYVEFVHPDDRADVREWIATVHDPDHEADSYHVEYRVQRPDGDLRWVEADGYPVRDPDGTVRKYVGIINDITDLKRRERELEAKNERLDQFASLVSHDLRNPLQVALSRLEAAREREDAEPHLESAERSLHRMNRLIDDVLDMARQEQSAPDLEPLSLESVARRAWKSVGSDAATLVVETDESLTADADRLVQLLENLFRNSVEHGDAAVTVRVGLLDGGDGFYVADDGDGIPAADRDGIFEVGHSTASDGTGLGLAMVEEIATSHGWSVTVTDADQGGARFEFADVY